MTMISTTWRILGRSPFFWIGAAFAALGVLFFVVGLNDARQALALRQHGISARATVVSHDIRPATGKDHPTTQYVLHYEFRSVRNERIAGVAVVPVEQWEDTREGATLPIHYLPDRPRDSRLAGDAGWGVAPGFIPIGALFGALGITFVFLRLRRLLLVTRLARDGALAEGTLTRVGPGSVWINRVRQWQLEYQFTDAAGQRRMGRTDSMAPKIAQRWKRGERGPVRYDAHDPRRSIWVDVEAPQARDARS
jgi:hypothetical protein